MNAVTEPMVLELEPSREVQAAQDHAVALADNSPMSMMLAAQRQGATLADVREMMAIHREMKADEARETFRADFAAFRGENVIIPKTKHVDRGRGGSFDQAEYDEVCRRLSPALSRHGFSFRHDQKFGLRRMMTEGVENDIGWVWVTCHLEHRKGHAERLELEGPPGDLSVNTPTQNMQTTASYLKRQSLLAITGTATGGEDDEAKMRGAKSEEAKRIEYWKEKVALAGTARDLQDVRRDGTKDFQAASDSTGYSVFATAVKARAAQLESEHA
ncbi:MULTISPECIES: hypothetical protein [unclassified Variovorax]|uniref:hypothetical protein n=1 Tax=unclassified Variovorax TaxID=663243 RepID=UPI003F48158A